MYLGPLQAASGAGSTAANFLKIPVAAIPSGLGEAYTAMTGPDSALYNPAGLGLLRRSAFSGGHNQYLEGISQEYLALAWRLPYGTIGAAFTTLSNGDIDAYDANDVAIGKTSTGHRLLSLSYARSWPPMPIDSGKTEAKRPAPKPYRISAGVTVKAVNEKLDSESYTSYAYDAGLAVNLPHGFRVGAAALNLGGEQAGYSLPSALRLGAARGFRPFKDKAAFTVTTDLVKESDRGALSATGLEVDLLKTFQLRLGYKTRKDAGTNFCGGFGLNLDRLAGKRDLGGARLDYAYLAYGDLGVTHRFGVQFAW